MDTGNSRREDGTGSQIDPAYPWLERLTGTILLLVLSALAWMIVAAAWPSIGRLPSVQYEVVVMLILLGSALLLVSLVALLHTRR